MPAQKAGPAAENTKSRKDSSSAAAATARELCDEVSRERIALRGPIERDFGHAVFHCLQDQRFAHGEPGGFGCCGGRRIRSTFSGSGIRSSNSASENVLPWLSVRKERLAPPASTFDNTKL